MSRLWYVDCPECDQGRLFVQRKSGSSDLFLECEECYVAWNHPAHVGRESEGYLSIDIPSEDATKEDILAAGWMMYSFHVSQD